MPLSAYATDNFIAPDMSRFNSAQIKDMSGTSVEQEHWLSNYVLNSLFRVDLDEPLRQTLFNFLRRTQFAFREYALAREQTMAYLRGVDAVPTYFLAIGHWETFLAYAYQAYETFVRAEKILFTTGDGSMLQRLNSLYNRSKHIASAINDNRIAPGSTLAVWLNNDGLRAVDSHLTFEEMAEILEDLARWSDAAQDPLTMREKILTQYPTAGDTPDEPDPALDP